MSLVNQSLLLNTNESIFSIAFFAILISIGIYIYMLSSLENYYQPVKEK